MAGLTWNDVFNITMQSYKTASDNAQQNRKLSMAQEELDVDKSYKEGMMDYYQEKLKKEDSQKILDEYTYYANNARTNGEQPMSLADFATEYRGIQETMARLDDLTPEEQKEFETKLFDMQSGGDTPKTAPKTPAPAGTQAGTGGQAESLASSISRVYSPHLQALKDKRQFPIMPVTRPQTAIASPMMAGSMYAGNQGMLLGSQIGEQIGKGIPPQFWGRTKEILTNPKLRQIFLGQ